MEPLKKDYSIEDETARKWGLETMRGIVMNPLTLDELNKQYNEWNGMCYDERRQSDWKSIELYGKSNKERYEEQLPKFLKQNIPTKPDGQVSVSEVVDYRDYTINKSLKLYIESTIMPEYERFDGAHNIPHLEKVIQSALFLGTQYNLDLNMIYTGAAYHDIGLREDRATHHIHSYDIVKNDTTLAKWFNPDDIEIIAMSCKDHRASSTEPPKTIYGRVIADADKTDAVNIKEMIKRSYTYTLAKNPHWDDDKIFDTVYDHLKEKYGEGGYAKVLLPETNKLLEDDRKESTRILASRTLTREVFNTLTLDINVNNVDKDIALFGTNVNDYEYFKNINNKKAIEDHGHGKIGPDEIEYAFHNDHNFKWSNNYKHSVDSSDNKEYEILHYKNKHIINQPYVIGHGLGNDEETKENWYYFTDKVKDQEGWYWMSSGKIVDAIEVPQNYKDMMVKSHTPAYEKSRTFSEQVEDYVGDDLVYPKEAGEKAELWGIMAMRTIIRPRNTEEQLESDWVKFNDMPLKNRRESDWKSLELFKVTNAKHFEFLRSKFLKFNIGSDIDSNEYKGDKASEFAIESYCYNIKNSTNNIDIIKNCVELANVKERTFSENILIQNTLDDTLESFNDNICDVENSDIFTNDMPFYSYNELIAFGVYAGENNRYSDMADNNSIGDDVRSKQWFDNYKLMFSGIATENTNKYTAMWVNSLNTLYFDYKKILESKDLARINARKQSILELGWNPNMGFTLENRMKANARLKNIIKEMYKDTTIIDLSSFVENHETAIEEAVNDTSLLAPVFIVFVKSDTFFNKVVTAVTKGKFGHVSIGFDVGLKSLYSYSVNQGGFSHESIDKYKDVSQLKVYCMLLKKSSVAKIKQTIRSYAQNEKNTDYSFLNLITIPLKIEYKSDTNMVCSQFVDAMLKIGKMDLTKKDSSLIGPKDLYSKIVRNKKLYKIYDGVIQKYNPSKVKSFLKSITDKLVGVSETTDTASYKTITFPKQEWNNLKARLKYNNIIYTTRVDKEYDKYKLLHLYKPDFDTTIILKVIEVETINDINNHKFLSELEPTQIKILSKYNKIDILKLERIDNIMEFSQVIDENTFMKAICENVNDIPKLQYLVENSTIDNKEYTKIYNRMIAPYTSIRAVQEAKEFPIQFDGDGNLLIQKMGSLDFEHEYSKSHKLLLVYEKNMNMDGIRYELCKLWYMNLILEKKLYANSARREGKTLNNKARSKVLNDFNKYLKLVMIEDPNFNFIEYYEETPFNDTKIKINSSTLKYTIQYIKSILL